MDNRFIEFNELLRKDKGLQKQLQIAKNEEDFIRLYCQLAKQKGYDISTREVRECLKMLKKDKSIQQPVTQEDLRKMAGGLCPVTTENQSGQPPYPGCPICSEEV